MNSPTWDRVWEEAFPLLDGHVMLGHNVGFDANVMLGSSMHYDISRCQPSSFCAPD